MPGIAVGRSIDLAEETPPVPWKECPKCHERKLTDEFGKNRAKASGLQVYCRACMTALRTLKQYDKLRWENNREQEAARYQQYREREGDRLRAAERGRAKIMREERPGVQRKYNIARKHGEIRATPAWADSGVINAIYRSARMLEEKDGVARHVDHVIPLRHPLVCGLHVQGNLEIKTAAANLKKHNSFKVCDG